MNLLYLSASFYHILNTFTSSFKNKQSFNNFVTLTIGWLLTPGRKTITRIIQTIGADKRKHHSCFYNFFKRAKWDINHLVYGVLKMIVITLIPEGSIVHTVGDDILIRQEREKDSRNRYIQRLCSFYQENPCL
ncbi:MAG: transposase [bacterium]